jgi:membrane-associated phospholipid phosphatase
VNKAANDTTAGLRAAENSSGENSFSLFRKARPVILVVAGLYGGYQITSHFQWREPVTLPLTWIDRALPLIEWTLWPYLILAACIFLPVLLNDRGVFHRCLVAIAIGYTTNLIVFAIWPTVLPREGLPGGVHRLAFASLYFFDAPTNCFPSGHITAPLITFHALAEENRRWRIWLWLVFAAMCPTILTTKQHYALDLAGGFATGILGLWLSGVWMRRREAEDAAAAATQEGAP